MRIDRVLMINNIINYIIEFIMYIFIIFYTISTYNIVYINLNILNLK
jgi:hypothetical protein